MKTQLPFVPITEYLIKEKPDLKAGKAYLLKYLAKTYPDYLLHEIKAYNFFVAQEEFENWVLNMIDQLPIPGNIKSIWFGLSRRLYATEPDSEFIRIYMIGSHSSPEEDEEWACYVDYDPDQEEDFQDPEIYQDLSRSVRQYLKWSEIKDAYYVETIIFLSLTCLLLTHALYNISDIILESRKDLHVGFGYPSGDNWYLGRLTKNGWES